MAGTFDGDPLDLIARHTLTLIDVFIEVKLDWLRRYGVRCARARGALRFAEARAVAVRGAGGRSIGPSSIRRPPLDGATTPKRPVSYSDGPFFNWSGDSRSAGGVEVAQPSERASRPPANSGLRRELRRMVSCG